MINRELLRAHLQLTYGVKCDLYQLHLEHQHSELFRKMQVVWWLDGSEIYASTISKKQEIQQSFRLDLTQLGNITDVVSLMYKGSIVKHTIQITIFQETETDFDHFILGFENNETKELCFNGIMHQLIQELDQIKFLKYQLVLLLEEHSLHHLQIQDVKSLLDEAQVFLSLKSIRDFFFETKARLKQGINYKDFLERVPRILYKEELQPLFMKYAAYQNEGEREPIMTSFAFKKFLANEQKQNLRTDEVVTLIQQISDQGHDIKQCVLNFAQFAKFIFSMHCHIASITKQDKYQDMGQPITDYFINSSRNSLQLFNFDPNLGVGEFSGLQILLDKGVRYLEIDVWENESKQPICIIGVFQNHTVMLSKLLQYLCKEAFTQSQCGLFLHFINHCSFDGTKEIWRQISDILESRLFLATENRRSLPTPKDLMYKFIITGPLKLRDESQFAQVPTENMIPIDSCEYRALECHEKILLPPKNAYRNSQQTQSVSNHQSRSLQCSIRFEKQRSSQLTQTEECQPFLPGPQRVSQYYIEKKEFNLKVNLYSESASTAAMSIFKLNPLSLYVREDDVTGKLSDLLVNDPLSSVQAYFEVDPSQLKNLRKRFAQLIICLDGLNYQRYMRQNPLLNESRMQSHRSPIISSKELKSISESSEESATSSDEEGDMDDIARINMIKFYPTNLRQDSSNQMVPHAFSMQFNFPLVDHNNVDLNYMYNYAKFTENGNCGYLLKPQHQRQSIRKTDPIIMLNQFDQVQEQNTLRMEIISGCQLQGQFNEHTDALDPRVQLSLIDPSYDQSINISQSHSTTSSPMNAFHPTFNFKCEFHFSRKDTAVVVFQVFNKYQQQVVSWNAVPLSIIKPGYRVVPLKDRYLNDLYNSYLLCHIEFTH